MDGLVIISILLLGGFLLSAQKNKGASGMEDTPVSIDNIRKGVSRGWYTATLTRVNVQPAIILSGRTADGKLYSDTYPISEQDWQTLKAEGYKVE